MGIGSFLNQLKSPRNSAAFTVINVLLGAGPLIIPEPFFRAGFFFSIIWTLVVGILSYITIRYVEESIILINKHMSKNSLISHEGGQQEGEQSEEKLEQDGQNKYIRTFDHGEQFEYLYGQKWKFVPSIIMIVFLTSALSSKCIMTGNILSKIFVDVNVLESYYFWLGIFFVIGAAFSFKSIQKTKIVQALMITFRLLSVILMLVGSIMIMIQNGGVKDLAPEGESSFLNTEYFGDIFSNLIFTFLAHTSAPGITRQLTAYWQIKSFFNIGFVVAGTVMLIIPITATLAFGNELVHRATDLGVDHSLTYYNEDFKGRIDFIYYIVSFYVFLSIAIFPVYIILVRRNIVGICWPSVDPDKISKLTAFLSLVILGIVFVISFVLRNSIQTAFNITAGVFGCCFLFFIPSMEVIKARALFPRPSLLNSYVWTPYVMFGIGFASMCFNLYHIIDNLIGN